MVTPRNPLVFQKSLKFFVRVFGHEEVKSSQKAADGKPIFHSSLFLPYIEVGNSPPLDKMPLDTVCNYLMMTADSSDHGWNSDLNRCVAEINNAELSADTESYGSSRMTFNGSPRFRAATLRYTKTSVMQASPTDAVYVEGGSCVLSN